MACATLLPSVTCLCALCLPGSSPLLRLRLLQHGLVVLLIHCHRILRLHNPINQSIPAQQCPFSGLNVSARVTLFNQARTRVQDGHDLRAILNSENIVAQARASLNGLLRCEVSVAAHILAHLLLVMPCAKRSSPSIDARASLPTQVSLQRTCQRVLLLHLYTHRHPACYS